MIIDRPPPPAAKDCKICIFSTQIIPLILGNDLESMATEPMYVSYVKYKDQSSWEMKSGKEGGGGKGCKERTNEGGGEICSPWRFCHHDSQFSVGPDLQNRPESEEKEGVRMTGFYSNFEVSALPVHQLHYRSRLFRPPHCHIDRGLSKEMFLSQRGW